MKVPLTEIPVDAAMRQAAMRVLDSGRFVKGPENAAFEREFAAYLGVPHATAVNSGTAALELGLRALDLRPGQEVLLPSFSFIATAAPVLQLGARPVFVDIDPETYNLDPTDVRRKVTRRTAGILPVHLYGHPADLRPLQELAKAKDLWILEDACQAHGAEYHGRKVGTFGDVSAFSFYPSKNMTVLGDGGMVATPRKDLADRVRVLLDAGRKLGERYVHTAISGNYRLSEILAAIGRVQLTFLPGWVERRRQIAAVYTEALSDVRGTSPPVERPSCRHSFYCYTIRTRRRKALAEYLEAQGIATGHYYPLPIHRQPALPAAYRRVKLPETDKATREVLSLPIFPRLAEETARRVAGLVTGFLRR